MSDEALDPAPAGTAKKPARKPGARSRDPKTNIGATKAGAARVPVSVVPEIPAVVIDAPRRPASVLRLGLLTSTLALLIGYLAWFSDVPELSRPEPAQVAAGPSSPAPGPDDPLAPHVRQGIEQELRLAAMALEIRESQESLVRLWDDARSLASSIGALASGIESLKSDIDAARTDAATGLARIEGRLHHMEVAAGADLSTANDLIAQGTDILSRLGRLEAQARSLEAGAPVQTAAKLPARSEAAEPDLTPVQAAEPLQPATTAGLPETSPSPQATVTVSFANTKPRARAPKPIKGWLVHSVRDDLALLDNEGTHYEARAGELLPGAGIVRSIKRGGERWVVLTSKGVISEPK